MTNGTSRPEDKTDVETDAPKPHSGQRMGGAAEPGRGPSFNRPKQKPSAIVGEIETLGPSPLVQAAAPLLYEMAASAAAHEVDAASLRSLILQRLLDFRNRMKASGVGDDAGRTAFQAVCSFVDDVANGARWGKRAGWAQKTISFELLGRTDGGETFYEDADRSLTDPIANRDLLHLFYVLLSLGFGGRHAGEPARVEDWRRRIFGALTAGASGLQPLSPHWRGEASAHRPLLRRMPVWAIAAACALVAAAVYSALLFDLQRRGSRALKDLTFAAEAPPAATEEPAEDEIFKTVVDILAPEVNASRVAPPENGANQISVVIQSSPTVEFFASGSATMNEIYRNSTMQRVAEAADAAGGVISITGHTDNQPSKISCDHECLSSRRASAVADALAEYVKRKVAAPRLIAAGDSEPRSDVEDPNTPEGRRLHRRVVVVLAKERN